MGKVREFAEKLWTEETSTAQHNPVMTFLGLEPLADDLAFVSGFANVVAAITGDGLVLIDTGSDMSGRVIAGQIAAWSDAPVHTAIYTHGHVDHTGGIAAFEREPGAVRVVGHEAVAARFDRYKATAGYNGHINARQFRVPGLAWPTDYRYPDVTYRDALELQVGGVSFALHHDRGETDDHTWVWLPSHRALCTGDLFIWASPNCGNPQKAQRYPREWAAALRRMAALNAELLLPGHGPPIFGAARIAQALDETATLLESLCAQTLALMNEGATLDRVLAEVTAPAELLARPYLRPVYDDPAFIVRNLWRLYGGWWDGNAARLEPPRDAAIGAEVAQLAGGAAALAQRARKVADAGDIALACQLAEWAWAADPADAQVRDARAELYRRRADASSSLMARSIYADAASRSSS